ncbi:Inner membrane transport protein ydhP (plasmid) [Tsukamurella tyrosinosolvens]|uniref:MFS transporter, DHA1 family, arabinose polymer transporter n=1 Tax=Tsukamurella tyrosinosolvens TaxID=57704 RepID=A0A1H4Y231_TSUTY|nr:MFS transporter [Tsukamurella tyrosinosolvens]KXP00191.1 MFS transporter [Tsukamurella tyrosinosolvens]SED11430.1 MFS transporter, DHA1 family, arabinose polymer transporter [Tsukamurella tyrosinosolvens]VEH97710.1 Inner membrane transport protein ydhP [Tsukamurella tyrosinosolvens]
MPIALLALALGGFGIGLTEFVIMGLLPEVAADFAVTETVAGYLISGYALSVAVGGIILTAGLGRVNRKHALLGLLVLFIAGNLMSALAGSYEFMLAGRVVAALCHGAFFGIGAVVAADLVPENRRAAAISIMFAGLTVSNVLGVPLGTFLGQAAGWRSTFWAITIIGVIALVGIAVLVRPTPAPATGAHPFAEFRIFRSPQVWLSMLVTVLGYGGMFGAFTYIAFTFTEVSGFASSSVPWLLVLFGAGLFAGNLLGGRAADRNLPLTLIVLLAALTVLLGVFALTATSQIATVIALVLMGAFGFATVPGLQMRIMNYAGDAPTLASGANIAAFNLGNAFGAWAGGLTLAAGLGYVSPLWVGAGITLAGLVAYVVATRVAGGEHAPDAATAPVPVAA